MSNSDLDRLDILGRALERRITQRKAAQLLGLCDRQTRRLMKGLRERGPAVVVSRLRGRPSNRRLSVEFKAGSLDLIRERYGDFGPTLANEKLCELHKIKVSTETLRVWMTEAGIWTPRKRRSHIHPPRHRRECLGELVQIDGSLHHWFEDRGPACVLLVYVDDATSRLMQLCFVNTESAFDYFDATKGYLLDHGKPMAFYSDKHTIFRAPTRSFEHKPGGQTQFGRALSDLNIDIICANTPEAKGRVERANKTLQDRLVKELRLQGISDMESANAFAPTFIEDFNRRFAVAPQNAHDAHRHLRPSEDLNEIFTWQERRKITKDLVVHYKHKQLQIRISPETRDFAGKTCTVFEWPDGKTILRVGSTELPYSTFNKLQRVTQASIVENKHLAAALEFIRIRQNQRDEERLQNPKITLRQKARLRAEMSS